ncbi:MAG TPA: TonB-dependent receptor [Nevskiales bacterium]|nr:TonB-dependent receptor [Nevskiales bacterium]
MRKAACSVLILSGALPAAPAMAHVPVAETLPALEVKGERVKPDAASAGTLEGDALVAQPIYRAGDILENVPGLILTQHSGEGKANQFFLRGFNLDHGTDFAITVDGMPVNLRSHGHGQGYADLGFVIPELVDHIHYRKGPYYPDAGDFSAAGNVHVDYRDELPRGLASGTLGEDGARRLLLADSQSLASGRLLYALERLHHDGPWQNPDDYHRTNAVLRYSQGNEQAGFGLSFMGHDAAGNATNQIPLRAVESGALDRFGSLDPSDGSDSYRYSLSGRWHRRAAGALTEASAYAVRSDLALFSNFTYFQNDPVNGDQFEQRDDRKLYGFDLSRRWFGGREPRPVENALGLQFRHDDIANGLFNTRQRQRLSTTRADDIEQTSTALYWENRVQWQDRLRTTLGLRADFFRAEVDSDNPANSGRESDSIVNPQFGLVYGPFGGIEYFFNAGGGYHSNDARGTTITVDPVSGLAAEQVPYLVRAKGYEFGVRHERLPGLKTAFALFALDFDSELVFVGDAGSTEAGRPSRRIGAELSLDYLLAPWLLLDADLAYARARFRDSDPAGDRIPGAVEGVASLGLTVDQRGPWFGAVHLRWFGPRPLIEDDSERSDSTTLLSARVGYRISERLRIALDGFNLLDRKDSQIDYFYESQLPGEAAPVEDVHFHPVEPRSFRLSAIAEF